MSFSAAGIKQRNINIFSVSFEDFFYWFRVQSSPRIPFRQYFDRLVFLDFGYHDDNQKNLQLKQKSLIKKGQLGRFNCT